MAERTFESMSKRIHRLLRGEDSIRKMARMLHHWALYKSYQDMVGYIKEARQHPGLSQEIQRKPILLDLFLRHLRDKAHLHIDVDTNSFFNEAIIGSEDEWEVWQENGYSLSRTEENFPKRLQRWINYYNASKQTYEKTIDARNNGYLSGDIVPYWKLWEVGVIGGAAYGYPSYTGLFYVDKAYQTLPTHIASVDMYLDSYAANYLDGEIILPAPFRNTQWKSVLRKSGL